MTGVQTCALPISVLATYGGQALGLYRVGQPAGFIGSVLGAIVLLVLVRLFAH